MSQPLLDKREDRIRRMFGEIAPWYDLLNHLLSLNIDRRWRRRAARELPAQGDAPILDLCTGTGDLALEMVELLPPGVPIVGVDFSHEMLVRAEKKTEQHARGRIRYVEADAQHLPFPDNTFQITAIAFGLRNITDTDRGLAEMARVTTPGGRVAVLEFSRPTHWFFGRMYRYYFKFLLPLIGQMFSRSRDNAYQYLPASVHEFPDGEALAEKMRSHGLGGVRIIPFTFGIATLYIGVKGERR